MNVRNGLSWGLSSIAIVCLSLGATLYAQRPVKRHLRATPPVFQADEFPGVFFEDALSQLQGEMPINLAARTNATGTDLPREGNNTVSEASENAGKSVWKVLVSDSTLEDLVKESKSRLDAVITTPAKFAGGGVADARREFTLLASLMAVVAQYPEEIRWQSSASYAQRVFARMAMNCKVGTQPVFNEAKLRQQDLQTMLKGTKISGNADEVSWADTADRGPSMQILEWALRENLAPVINSDSKFRESQEDVLKYAELIAMFGQIVQQPGMTDADDEQYIQFAMSMTKAAQEVSKAARTKDAELARAAVGRMDQACSKCHESYR